MCVAIQGWIEGSSSSTTLSTSSTVGTPNEESSDVYEMLDVPGCLETETAADSDKEEREVQEDTPPPKKMKISASIPDPFVFPKIYPARIQQAVVSGKIYGTDRLAFIRYISDFMAGYSSFPSPSEYQRVACDIVEKYPCLADKLQGQPVWVSSCWLLAIVCNYDCSMYEIFRQLSRFSCHSDLETYGAIPESLFRALARAEGKQGQGLLHRLVLMIV